MADNAPILVIVPPRTAAKREVEEDWGPWAAPLHLRQAIPTFSKAVYRRPSGPAVAIVGAAR
jgi:hypothetical protein